ncbi:DUF2283 domain-containing protein [Candidatus Pacearchaeota archaeon]|nr:DUF2283 domain-containing protein [Candidatus Pacearchaeota archaeon]
MKINFDTKNDIMRIKFQDGEYETSKEIDEGIMVDMDKNNKIIAIEIIDASDRIPKGNLKEFSMNISE